MPLIRAPGSSGRAASSPHRRCASSSDGRRTANRHRPHGRARRGGRAGPRHRCAVAEHRTGRDLRAGRRVRLRQEHDGAALMRLLPEAGRVVSGRLDIGGQEMFGLPESAMRGIRGGRVGMIFQEPATSLNPVMRVGDQIVEAIELHTPLRGAAARTRAIEWLGRVGIPEPERRIDEYPFRLSGGQKQRVMIAMTLASEPDFLIADEPTTALDVTIQAQILELLKNLQKEQGMGMLLITHDLAVVSNIADRVALMYAGQIIEVAEADEFFAAPKHPYARLLLQALPDAARRGESLAAIKGSVPPLWLKFEGCRFTPRCDRAFGACPTTPPTLTSLGATRSVRCLLY